MLRLKTLVVPSEAAPQSGHAMHGTRFSQRSLHHVVATAKTVPLLNQHGGRVIGFASGWSLDREGLKANGVVDSDFQDDVLERLERHETGCSL